MMRSHELTKDLSGAASHYKLIIQKKSQNFVWQESNWPTKR